MVAIADRREDRRALLPEKWPDFQGKVYHEGDFISIDGTTGNVYGVAIKTVPASISGYFGRFMAWADETRKLQVSSLSNG